MSPLRPASALLLALLGAACGGGEAANGGTAGTDSKALGGVSAGGAAGGNVVGGAATAGGGASGAVASGGAAGTVAGSTGGASGDGGVSDGVGGSIVLGGMPSGGTGGGGGSAGGAADPFPGCPNCRRIFDGKTLDGWIPQPANNWDVNDDSLHITGAARGYLYTKDDYTDYRIILSVRQVVGNHDPCVLFFGTRPAPTLDALGAIQFQLPNHYTWDYRPGHNDDGGKLFSPQPHPTLDRNKWNQCEVLMRASTGQAKMTCCELVNGVPCKGVEHNRFNDPTAGKKGPFALQSHNAGIQDEYKDIFVDMSPVGDDLITVQ